jgi:hypothetical protein
MAIIQLERERSNDAVLDSLSGLVKINCGSNANTSSKDTEPTLHTYMPQMNKPVPIM